MKAGASYPGLSADYSSSGSAGGIILRRQASPRRHDFRDLPPW